MYRTLLVAVDGENMVFRYQAMLQGGRAPRDTVRHRPDVYVWEPSAIRVDLHEILRAHYYTSATGNDPQLEEIRDEIRAMPSGSSGVARSQLTLTAHVFKKPSQKDKAKGVDIQLAVDVLNHVHRDTVDAIYLISGDGDYLPLADEVARCGKQIYIAAFSSGLNPMLRRRADKFVELDNLFFTS